MSKRKEKTLKNQKFHAYGKAVWYIKIIRIMGMIYDASNINNTGAIKGFKNRERTVFGRTVQGNWHLEIRIGKI